MVLISKNIQPLKYTVHMLKLLFKLSTWPHLYHHIFIVRCWIKLFCIQVRFHCPSIDVRKKEKYSHSAVCASYDDWAPWTGRLPVLAFSLATLIRTAEAGKMTYCQGCDGSRDSGKLLTPNAKNIQRTKAWETSQTAKRFKALML